jgi:hypothetical protein
MSQAELFALEGRINGLRDILEIVVSHLVRKGDEELLAVLAQQALPLDHQEDPGAVPLPALAVEGAARNEIQILLERIRANLAGDEFG